MIDELKHFGFKDFTPGFLAKLKQEIPALLELVQSFTHNFEGEDAEEEDTKYRDRVKDTFRRARQRSTLMNIENTFRQQEHGDVDEDDVEVGEVGLAVNIEALLQAAGEEDITQEQYREMNWMRDIGERARRVYGWWKAVMTSLPDASIPSFYKAVKLIAVTQVSSAAAERVFSQLTFIRRAVGDKTLQDMMELRTFIRCNNTKYVENYDDV